MKTMMTIQGGFYPNNWGPSEPFHLETVWCMERSRVDFFHGPGNPGGLIFTGPTPKYRTTKRERRAEDARWGRSLAWLRMRSQRAGTHGFTRR